MLERLTRGSQRGRRPRLVAVPRPAGARIAAALLPLAVVVGSFTVSASARSRRAGGPSLVCGLDDRRALWPVSIRTGARKVLVPHGAISLTVCRYNGMNANDGVPQFGLLGVGETADRATIDQLTDELDALKSERGVINCPMDDSSQDVAYFDYASGPSIVVTAGTNGCNDITNGHIHRLGLGKPLVSQLSAIAKPIDTFKWATVVGHIQLCGGPAPGRCWFQKQTYPYASRAVATNSNGLWVAMAQLTHNRFRFTIATPGRYSFELMGSGKHINTVISRTRATVRAGATTTVVFTIPVP